MGEMNATADVDPLTDEQVTAYIDDPATIPTHEAALEVMGVLDAEIAEIQAQLDADEIAHSGRARSMERDNWYRRASYARNMKQRDRNAVYKRDREIRHIVGPAMTAKRGKSPEELAAKQAKQDRLKAEAEARREAKKADNLKRQTQLEQFAIERSFHRCFVAHARTILTSAQFTQIQNAANAAMPSSSRHVASEDRPAPTRESGG